MDLRTFLTRSPELANVACAEDFAAHWTPMRLSKGAHANQQGQPERNEYIVLDGCLTSTICDQDGKEVCVGFYVGPCVVTPNIARTREGMSLVSVAATTDASLVRIDTDLLTELMVSAQPIRNWGNAVMRDTLAEKAEREWCLAALGGADRLQWFREAFPGYETKFAHSLIASFLGITPVTLSRLRARDKNM
ncbi:Crp/Fnr family transcriptional regulator [Gymnodinialimonas sp.]